MASSKKIEIEGLDPAGLEQHLAALAEILHACVHAGASVSFILPFGLDQACAFWSGRVAPALAGGKRIVLVARLDGAIAGTVQLDLDTWPNQAHRGEINKLLVHPKHRRSGIGRALMQRAEAMAQAAGRKLLTLDTAGEAAERLYLSLGYERAGSIPGYARDPIEDRLDATTYMYKWIT
jgi:ribosomal protein S18 acetylase RimI-like enzyme